MIEVIFVIVVIGILASVALPKLAATRSDAEGAVIVNALSACINEAGNRYMLDGSFGQVTQSGASSAESCKTARECFVFTETDSSGSLQVQNSTSTSKKCIEAQRIASENLLATTHIINF